MTGRTELVTVVLVAILAVALVATLYFLSSSPPNGNSIISLPNSTTSGSTANAYSTNIKTTPNTSRIPIGAFLYVWYGNSTSRTNGLGSPGWNSTSCPGGGAVVDQPTLGFYASDDNATIRRQISEMKSAGIDFAIISWWGPFNDSEAGSINRATLDWFKFLRSTNSSFRLAVMVDAFPKACGSGPPDVPMATVEDYIQRTFAIPFARWYFSWEGRPLLLFFNPLVPGPNSNFTLRTIGNRPNTVDWTFWDAPASFYQGEGGTGVNASNDIGNPAISPLDGEVTVTPRIDSYYNYASGDQTGFLRFDSSLQLGLYSYEWNYIISHRSEVKLVLIYSFNEFHERSAIEPDTNISTGTPASLLNQTATFVAELEAQDGSS